MKQTVKLVISILLPLAIGTTAGLVTDSTSAWFKQLNKPEFNPPGYVFAPVWTCLYILMGISFYLILKAPKSNTRTRAIAIFVFQLALNFLWSFLFFEFHFAGIAFIEIIILWASVIWMIYVFSKIHKIAALLQLPYILWVSFASVLNGSIWYLNQ